MGSVLVDPTATGRDSVHQRRTQSVKEGQGNRLQRDGRALARGRRDGDSRTTQSHGKGCFTGEGSTMSDAAERKGDKLTHGPWIR